MIQLFHLLFEALSERTPVTVKVLHKLIDVSSGMISSKSWRSLLAIVGIFHW